MTSRAADLAVDELATSLMLMGVAPAKKAKAPAGKPKGGGKQKGKPKEKDTPAPKEAHDRWTLQDESTIDYGFLSKTGGSGSKEKSFYITTAINYANGPAHMGHAYEGTTSDVIARFARLCGDQSVYFVTGSDEHGQKIATTAEEAGQKPIDLCDKFVLGFKNLNQRTLVSNDDYIRTTSDRHKKTAQELWRKVNEAGDIYLDTYEGWYNVREETFVTENDAALSNYLDPASGKPLKKVQEASYFFKMSKYKDRLIDYIENVNPDFICPTQHKNQILSRLKSDDLRDLSISRATFSWGIKVPEGFEENHVMYVWMDALTNYLTGVNALGLEDNDLAHFWPASVHIIGKDILWFHTVIWPCLLFSAKVPLPKKVYAHGFVNDKDGKKMSKSLGNVVDPHDMLDKFHVDTFRWYLSKEAPYGGELSFSEDNVRDIHNSDLCDTLGNGVHRATTLCGKKDFCDGVIPDIPMSSTLPEFLEKLGDIIDTYRAKMELLELHSGAQIAIQGFRDINGYLAKEEPWKLKGDENKVKRQTVVRTALEAIYAFTHLLLPFLPIGAKEIFKKLNTDPISLVELKKRHAATPGQFLAAGTKVVAGGVLYEKSLSEDEIKDAAAAAAKKKESYADAQKRKKEKKLQDIANSRKAQEGVDPNQPEFTKLDIRVGKIVKVWNHESADKLFCEEIDLAEEGGPRQIASGLRGHYTLEEMQDTKVLVVCNLKAAKIVGFSSNGMVLAAKGEDGAKVELVCPPEDAPVGERVTLEGLEGTFEPLSSAQTKKKKTMDAVAKELKTADGGLATWQGKTIITTKGPCKAATLVGAPIS
ncbi:Methionine--tRNA ligase [Seminavis robusta]|uniref:methionine--tRNA ligase n=1 Tax=Seminavis robusta TaxID=568900 RepID=A0A9N8HG35_9STRA|nr:Methionine--tRNA ligase [Seminavis robusta]|eukprot:Sro555_g165630.1 Methionine--tRNA ligase (818) ;mRNA; f:7888-10539